MNKPSFGVVVGRFQVNNLHEGHWELLKAVNSRHTRVIVFLGCNPSGLTKYNPLNFEARKGMIQEPFPDFTILPIGDQRSDKNWSKELDKRIDEVVNYGEVTLYGSRDSFIPHYSGKYSPIELSLDMTQKDPSSGTDIREKITNTVLNSSDFRAGMIYTQNNMWPRVITCVDALIVYGTDFLMGRKAGETSWRFIGGHAEASQNSFEDDIKKEIREETSLTVTDLSYLGSSRISDWRWRNNSDSIKTLLFQAIVSDKNAKAGDDIEEIAWFETDKLFCENFPIVEEHKALLDIVRKKYHQYSS